MAARPRVRLQLQDEEVAFLGALSSVRAGGSVAGRVGSTRLFRPRGGRIRGGGRRRVVGHLDLVVPGYEVRPLLVGVVGMGEPGCRL